MTRTASPASPQVVRSSACSATRARVLPCGDLRIYLKFEVRRVHCRRCGGVKQERLEWLAGNPHYTKRFALYVGKQCRSASIKEVANDLRLDWHASKRWTSSICGSNWRGRAIWFGGVDRSEDSMAMFYDFLGAPRGRSGFGSP